MEVGRSIFRAIADFSGIRREAGRTARDLAKMQKIGAIAGNLAGSKFASGFVRGMMKVAMIAPIIGAIGAAGLASAGAIVQLGASIATLGGLAVPAVAVMGAMVTAGAALGMGLKAMKTRLADLAPGFKAMSDSVGSNFMYFAEKPIRNMVKKLLPDLRDGMENIGSSWGKVAGDASNSLTKNLGGGVLSGMLEKTRQMVENTRPGIEGMIGGLTKVGVVGSQYLPALGTWVGNLGIKFGAFIDKANADGSLKAWADAGIQGLKDLGTIVKGIGGIFGALNKAADAAGATTTLGGLAAAMTKISEVMNAPVFQGALTEVFKGANAGAQGLLKAIGPIGDAFVQGAPALSDFLRLGGEILGLVAGGLATALSNPAFGAGLVAFMEGVKVGVQALMPILPVISTAFGLLMTALAPVIATLLPSLGTTFALLASALSVAVVALTPFLTVVAAMLPVLIPLGLAAMGVYKALMLFQQIKTIIAIVKSLAAAQWLWNLAMMANPIGLVIAAIAALVAGLIWFFTQTELGRQIWGGFVNWLGEVIGGFLNWWNGTAVPALQQGFTAIMAMVTFFVGMWQAGWNAVWGFVQMVFSVIVALVQMWVANVMSTLAMLGALAGLAWGWFMGMVNSAMTAGGQLLAWVGGLPGQILGMLGNLGGLLIGAGQSLIQGFIDGVSSMIGAVGAAVGGVMDFIGGFFPNSPAKRGEFSGKGWTPHRGKALMTGFSDGIRAGQQSGVDAAGIATTAISNQLHPVISPTNALGGVPAQVGAPALAPGMPGKLNPAPAGGGRSLSVEINNPAPEAPTKSIEKTYAKIAYLGLDAKEPAYV